MPRYMLTIAYDGTRFAGWQRQEPFARPGLEPPAPGPGDPNPDRDAWIQGVVHREGEDRPRVQLRTVQHVVERAVREIVREPVDLVGASRTDAGVHARGQVGAFTCSAGGEGSGWPAERGLDRLRRAINGRLPADVQVMDAREVPLGFDPIADPTSKGYRYSLHVSPPPPTGSGLRPLWDRFYVHHVWEGLDVEAMRVASGRVVGEHDFAAFAAAGHGRTSTVRTVLSCEVTRGARTPEGDRVEIEVSGTGFLYNMVRIIAGTLVEVGRGRMTPEGVSAALASRDRARAGPTLPPEGLCLMWIRYPESSLAAGGARA